MNARGLCEAAIRHVGAPFVRLRSGEEEASFWASIQPCGPPREPVSLSSGWADPTRHALYLPADADVLPGDLVKASEDLYAVVQVQPLTFGGMPAYQKALVRTACGEEASL